MFYLSWNKSSYGLQPHKNSLFYIIQRGNPQCYNFWNVMYGAATDITLTSIQPILSQRWYLVSIIFCWFQPGDEVMMVHCLYLQDMVFGIIAVQVMSWMELLFFTCSTVTWVHLAYQIEICPGVPRNGQHQQYGCLERCWRDAAPL